MPAPGVIPARTFACRCRRAAVGLLLAGACAQYGPSRVWAQDSVAPTSPPAATPIAPPAPASSPPPTEQDFDLGIDEGLDVGVAWPDLNAELDMTPLPEDDAAAQAAEAGTEDGFGEEPTQAVAEAEPEEPELQDDGEERRYTIAVEGVEGVADPAFLDRFQDLSLLDQGKGKKANLAQINRRMRLDEDLLDKVLRADGYYDAIIRSRVAPPADGGNGRLRVIFTVQPGARYTLASVDLPGLSGAAASAPMLRTAFPVNVGDPVDADDILAAREELTLALGQSGFPFARVGEAEVVIDHDTEKGDLDVPITSGGFRRFGSIVLDRGSRRLFTAKHLTRIARFDRDDTYIASDVEDLRRAIVATGLVSSVELKPRETGDGEHVDVAVAVTPAKMRTIAGEIGYGTGEGARLEASWQHRNLFPPEGALTVRGLIGTREQGAGVTFRRNNFRRRDNILTATLAARHQELDAYKASTATLSLALERQSNIIYQKKWSWSVGAELIASRESDFFPSINANVERDYLIAALPASVLYDASDDLLDPKKGFRIGGRISPEVSRQDGSFAYVRTQIDGSVYVPVQDRVVVASRVRLGTILGGVTSDRIAPSRRFYAGGGASVRGYGYQAIGPRDPNDDPLGGKSLAEFSLEARIRFGNFGVVPFVDAGNISSGFLPKFSNFRAGAGLGLRYYSTFGPIRIDVGTPLNPQKGDSRIAVYVSLGQAF